MPSKKPKAVLFEFDWTDNKVDENGNVIPDSSITYYVCESIWFEDEDPIEIDGVIYSESGWTADTDKVIEEFNTEQEAQQFLLKIGGK